MTKPVMRIVSGPNGAGKSTFTRHTFERLDDPIIDPDRIAAGINPSAPSKATVAAGRKAVKQISGHIERGESFIQETTLSGQTALRNASDAKDKGFRVEQYFVGVDTETKSAARVAQRVTQGGHDIPRDAIKRRFQKSFANAERLAKIADSSRFYDNSDPRNPHRIVLAREGRDMSLAKDAPAWARAIHSRLQTHDRAAIQEPSKKPSPRARGRGDGIDR